MGHCRSRRRSRVWRPDWPCPVGRGALPPPPRTAATRPTAGRRTASIWRGIRTPEGTTTLRVASRARRRRRGRRRLGERGRLGPRPAAADARRRRRPERLRAAAPAGGRLAPPPPLAPRGDRPGDGVAGADDHRAEGHRAGGASPPSACWCTGSASARRPAERARPARRLWVQPSPERAARDPVLGLAAAARRRSAVAPDPARRAGRARPRARRRGRRRPSSTAGCARCPASGSGPAPRCASGRSGDADAVSFGDYHIAGQHRLRADRGAGRRRRARRAARAVRRAPPPGPAPGGAGRTRPARAAAPRMAPRTHLPRR